ncbi:helix-turn-helix domain-containing protein [Pseudomonas silvicola]|nr:helix-turn-helix domain-containing protein [Pseudomonas silvicola]
MLHFFQSTDMAEHASRLSGWQQRYDQLSGGPVDAALWVLDIGPIRLFRERLNQAAVQHMQLPREHLNLIFPLAWPQRDAQQPWLLDGLNLLPSQSEFRTVSGAGMDVLCLSMPYAELHGLLSDATLARCRASQAVRGVSLAAPLHQHARRELLELLCRPEPAHARQRVLDLTCQLLAGLDALPALQPSYSTRHYIVQRCHELVVQDPQGIASLVDLCKRLKISRRTLQYSFQSVADVNPVQYLRSVRLNEARRALSHSPEARISDIAAHWGFEHTSYFCAQYQKLFGEKPSLHRAH